MPWQSRFHNLCWTSISSGNTGPALTTASQSSTVKRGTCHQDRMLNFDFPPMQIDKVYEPQPFEPAWAQWWIDHGVFRATPRAGRRTFSIVIPPPNVTGVLHMGHMLDHTEIDVVTRWHRMRGNNTLWLPGMD